MLPLSIIVSDATEIASDLRTSRPGMRTARGLGEPHQRYCGHLLLAGWPRLTVVHLLGSSRRGQQQWHDRSRLVEFSPAGPPAAWEKVAAASGTGWLNMGRPLSVIGSSKPTQSRSQSSLYKLICGWT